MGSPQITSSTSGPFSPKRIQFPFQSGVHWRLRITSMACATIEQWCSHCVTFLSTAALQCKPAYPQPRGLRTHTRHRPEDQQRPPHNLIRHFLSLPLPLPRNSRGVIRAVLCHTHIQNSVLSLFRMKRNHENSVVFNIFMQGMIMSRKSNHIATWPCHRRAVMLHVHHSLPTLWLHFPAVGPPTSHTPSTWLPPPRMLLPTGRCVLSSSFWPHSIASLTRPAHLLQMGMPVNHEFSTLLEAHHLLKETL